MGILKIDGLEKQEKDILFFPAFDLKVDEGEITAIYSTLNIRSILLDMFTCKNNNMTEEIKVNDVSPKRDITMYRKYTGICLFEEGLYERLSVMDHFNFYRKLYEGTSKLQDVLELTQLETVKNKKTGMLSKSETRRVTYGRVLLQNPELFVFEEPDLNVDLETKRVFINILDKLQRDQKGVLILTGNMESAITFAQSVYRLDENGLNQLDLAEEEAVSEEAIQEPEVMEEEKNEQPEPFRFNKIPTRINEKIVLFDPPEIDYIESNDGQSNIYVKGEAFTSSLTLNNLEERLLHYGFFRCHRSYIVNLQKVREVITWTRNSYSLVLDDGKESSIPLSKTKMAELKGMLDLK